MARFETLVPSVSFGAISEAWRLYKLNWRVWALTMLIALGCDAILSGAASFALSLVGLGMFGGFRGLRASGASFVHVLVGMAISGFFLGGLLRMALNQVRGRRPRIEDLFSVTDVWFDLVLGSFLLGIPVLIGWAFFVIPGLIISGLMMFMYPLIVDARIPATGAMIQSFHVLKSSWVSAALFHLAIAAIAGLGALLGGLGLLVTGPLYALSIAVLYNEFFPVPPYSSGTKPDSHFGEL